MSGNVEILALDLALKTGWAHSDGPSGMQDFKKRRGESPGMLWLNYKAWLRWVLEMSHTDVIAYEQAHHRGGHATKLAYGFISCTEEIAADKGIEITTRHSASIKNHALKNTKGKRSKARMIQAAENKWPGIEIIDDNHADALWLLDLVQTELGMA